MGMSAVVFARKGNVLRPADDEAREALRRISPGVPVMVDLRQRRNVRQHRLYWKLIRTVHRNLPKDLKETWPTVEKLSDAIKIALGACDGITDISGSPRHHVPHSIAFDKMDQTTFQAFFEQAVNLIRTRIVPGLAEADLEAEVMDLVA